MADATHLPAAGAPPEAPALTHRQILVIMAGLMSGMFLASLDQTIVSTSIRTIADDLNGLTAQAWVTTAYLITSTISTPLYGKLSDIYGRRPFFLTAITVFVLGSLASGMATSIEMLSAFRAFQGIGAGGLFSLALAIIGDIVPPRERARYQGFFLAVFGTSSVLGPVVGGALAGQETLLGTDGWRWVFLLNVPVGLVAFALVARVLHVPHVRRDHRIDWPGAVTLVLGVVPLLTVAEQGREWGWTDARSVVCYVMGVVFIAAFVVVERTYGDEALLPLRLFTGRTFTIGTVLNVLVGMGMFGGMACLPLYLQIVKGATPTESGLLLLPLMLGMMLGSIGSGQYISKTGRYKIFPVVGLLLLTGALFAFSRITADTSIVAIDAVGFVFGLGLGFNMQTLVLAIQNSVPPRDMGVATSSATFFRSMGGTLGTAVFLSVLFNALPEKITAAFTAAAKTPEFQQAVSDPAVLADPDNAPVTSMIKAAASGAQASFQSSTLNDSTFISALDPRLARPILVGFAESTATVFWLSAFVVLVGLVVVFFLPEEPLRTQSGIDASRQQSADAARAAAVPQARTVEAVNGTPVGADAAGRLPSEDDRLTGPAAPGGPSPTLDRP